MFAETFAEGAMKYCLFCRESYEDEMQTCPYCGDDLLDELPEEGDAAEAYAYHGGHSADQEQESEEGQPVIQAAIITSQDDLEAAVDVLTQGGIYFEIEDADRMSANAGIIPARAWRLLVEQDQAHDAFVRLVSAIPQAFPRVVAEEVGEDGQERRDESAAAAVESIENILNGSETMSDETALAGGVIAVFSCEDPVAIARTKLLLARRGESSAEMLSRIAIEAAGAGGEGAESVLFHTMQVLEALSHDSALTGMEQLYKSPVAQVRTRSAWAAGRLGNPEAVDRLLDLLEDEDEDVRYEASESIWRLTGFDFDFEPEAPVEKERENVEGLRRMWARTRKAVGVRGRTTLKQLLQGLGGGV